MRQIEPPDHFSESGKALYRSIARGRNLWDERDMMLLRNAIEQWERAEQCRLRIATEGLTVKDRFKQDKPNPAVIAERQARLAFAKLEMDLPWRQKSDVPREQRP
jgi:P27 family predicted phage terminase small subunit